MWDLKYRPQVFSDVLGQEGVSQVLQARLRKGEAFDTSYIFAGGHGCGKTTLSRILARAMLCQDLKAEGNPCNQCDHCKACLNETMAAFTELDAASQGTTADMRRLVENLSYTIPGISKRIYLLDESHRMSRDAQDVLLKPIEDKRVIILFCTTELAKIRDTISSRCEVHEIRKIGREETLKRMLWVLQEEKVSFEEDAVLTVIDSAKGHVRDTLNKLETIAHLGPVTLEAVRERLNLSLTTTYYEILLSLGEPSKAMQLVEMVCDKVGPSDASAGLAEAAMNSYRHALKVSADFAIFDRDLALKVHETFKSTLPSIARFFLRNPYPTRLGLLCDIVSLCESGGSAPQTVLQSTTPPIVVQPQAVAVASTVSQETTPVVSEVIQPVEVQFSKPTPPTNTDPAKEQWVREDGKGPLGSSDPEAKTALDHKVIPTEHPRGYRDNRTLRRNGFPKAGEAKTLTPLEFRKALHNLLRINSG